MQLVLVPSMDIGEGGRRLDVPRPRVGLPRPRPVLLHDGAGVEQAGGGDMGRDASWSAGIIPDSTGAGSYMGAGRV